MNSADTARSPSTPVPRGRIILLHGLGVTSWTMTLLARWLRGYGYQVDNWGYGSIRQSLERLIPHFQKRVEAVQAELPPDVPLYMVGHSMGSIIVRAIASRANLPSLRRVVMLTPPNGGSHLATTFGKHLLWLTRLVDELSDREDSLVNMLPRNLSQEVGVIAADRDYLVREPSTHLECECDHIVLPSRHTALVFKRHVAEQIAHFLDHGKFLRNTVGHDVPTKRKIDSVAG